LARRKVEYESLFASYQEMDADYGIMVDYFLDPDRTCESAQAAVWAYERDDYAFKLVLVAQGETTEEYVECYRQLSALGSYPIAVGGLLRRKINSARYIHVSQDDILAAVLHRIRKEFDPAWLFALGAYHPKRHELLDQYRVFGADYKGWIFNYTHRRELILKEARELVASGIASSWNRLGELLRRRISLAASVGEKRSAMRGNLRGVDRRTAKEAYQATLLAIDYADAEIGTEVQGLIDQAEAGAAYPEGLSRLWSILQATEQAIRFDGVHSYFESNLLHRSQPAHPD
jgi:hypothetical protein